MFHRVGGCTTAVRVDGAVRRPELELTHAVDLPGRAQRHSVGTVGLLT